MKNSSPVILSSVLLSAFLSISGVQGQNFPADGCNLRTTDALGLVVPIEADTSPFYNVQTIYSFLCEERSYTNGVGTAAVSVPAFTQFTEFCDAVDLFPEDIKPYLNEARTSGITVFAPVNQAFGNSNSNNTLLETRRILEAHIFDTPLLVNALECGETIPVGIGPSTAATAKTRTKCVTAGTSNQVGQRNVAEGTTPPQIGAPAGQFSSQPVVGGVTPSLPSPWGAENAGFISTDLDGRFSQDAILCNGIATVVNNLILTGPTGAKGGKASYYGSSKSLKSLKTGYNGKGAKGASTSYNNFTSYNNKGGKRRELDQEAFIEEELEAEEYEEEEEDSNYVPQQQDDENSRHQRRKRLLETLITPNGEVEQLE